ncbi:MAG: hypothetical protein FJZ47_25425 [Candidatus Tectomicrobia bacterium]|uniref:Sulfatase-modifying factor enzyme-like domain-containing protein n=1 Tax=Tectimicrobiota bacterium TaxID=2528274 RepID=A0A937W8U0_UNCTE|nr:hypothetical protein [Candidatus Tectomicrobia bacterium]
MAGNVWEWCWDGYAAYAPEAVVDPSGDDTSALRVLRGGGRTGSWPGTCGPRAGPGPSPRSGTTASGSAWCVVPAASLESLIFFEHLALIFLVITDSVAGLIAGGKLPLMTRCLGYSTTESISTIARPPWLR